jgi:hypothetical protein
MEALSKNHAARLKRVDKQLDTALDNLMRANGELWPKELRAYAQELGHAVDTIKTLQESIAGRLSNGTKPDPQPEREVDPDQEDIEDIEGVGGLTAAEAEEARARAAESREPRRGRRGG